MFIKNLLYTLIVLSISTLSFAMDDFSQELDNPPAFRDEITLEKIIYTLLTKNEVVTLEWAHSIIRERAEQTANFESRFFHQLEQHYQESTGPALKERILFIMYYSYVRIFSQGISREKIADFLLQETLSAQNTLSIRFRACEGLMALYSWAQVHRKIQLLQKMTAKISLIKGHLPYELAPLFTQQAQGKSMPEIFSTPLMGNPRPNTLSVRGRAYSQSGLPRFISR